VGATATGSVDGVIVVVLVLRRNVAVEIVLTFTFRNIFFVFVENGIRDYVFFRGPRAEIQEAAAFTAEREISIAVGIRRMFANGTNVFHGKEKFYHHDGSKNKLRGMRRYGPRVLS
jgi:hypothetical protein